MDLIPILNNWQEIVAVCGGYVYASIDVSRRLSWTWAENRRNSYYGGSPAEGYQFGAWLTAFFAMPAAVAMLHANTKGNGWNKAPRSVRRLEKRKEQAEAYEKLQKENERLEELLGISSGR